MCRHGEGGILPLSSTPPFVRVSQQLLSVPEAELQGAQQGGEERTERTEHWRHSLLLLGAQLVPLTSSYKVAHLALLLKG